MWGSALMILYQVLSLHEKKKSDKNLSETIRTGYLVRYKHYLLLLADTSAAYYCEALHSYSTCSKITLSKVLGRWPMGGLVGSLQGWPPALSHNSHCCSPTAAAPFCEQNSRPGAACDALPSHWLHLTSPAFESFLGSGLHWLHCPVASVKQGKTVKNRVCKEVNCCRALHANEWVLFVWMRSLLHKRAFEVLIFALFTLLMLTKSAGHIVLVILP